MQGPFGAVSQWAEGVRPGQWHWDRLTRRPAGYRDRRRPSPFHSRGECRGSAPSRWTQGHVGVEGAAGSCGCFNPQAVPASDAEAADTCSQALKTPFPTPSLCLADFGGD